MPDIAELRTKFTADDGDFQSVYKRVASALGAFLKNEASLSTATHYSATGIAGVTKALEALESSYNRVGTASKSAGDQTQLEVSAFANLAKILKDIQAQSRLTVLVRQKESYFALSGAQAQIAAAMQVRRANADILHGQLESNSTLLKARRRQSDETKSLSASEVQISRNVRQAIISDLSLIAAKSIEVETDRSRSANAAAAALVGSNDLILTLYKKVEEAQERIAHPKSEESSVENKGGLWPFVKSARKAVEELGEFSEHVEKTEKGIETLANLFGGLGSKATAAITNIRGMGAAESGLANAEQAVASRSVAAAGAADTLATAESSAAAAGGGLESALAGIGGPVVLSAIASATFAVSKLNDELDITDRWIAYANKQTGIRYRQDNIRFAKATDQKQQGQLYSVVKRRGLAGLEDPGVFKYLPSLETDGVPDPKKFAHAISEFKTSLEDRKRENAYNQASKRSRFNYSGAYAKDLMGRLRSGGIDSVAEYIEKLQGQKRNPNLPVYAPTVHHIHRENANGKTYVVDSQTQSGHDLAPFQVKKNNESLDKKIAAAKRFLSTFQSLNELKKIAGPNAVALTALPQVRLTGGGSAAPAKKGVVDDERSQQVDQLTQKLHEFHKAQIEAGDSSDYAALRAEILMGEYDKLAPKAFLIARAHDAATGSVIKHGDALLKLAGDTLTTALAAAKNHDKDQRTLETTKDRTDQQKQLNDEIESRRRQVEIMKLPENDYKDRISMDKFGVMASDLTNKNRKGYDPSQADNVGRLAGYEQQQADVKASAENEKGRLSSIGDEFQQQLDANLKWGIEDSAQKRDYNTVMQRISAETSKAKFRGTPDERQDFIDSGLADYKEKKNAYKDNKHLETMAEALGNQFDAQQQAGYAKNYQDAMKGLNAEMAKYSKETEAAKLQAIEFDGTLQKMDDGQAHLVLAMQEQVRRLKDWSDSVKEISKDLAGTVTGIMDKIFVEGSHHLQKNVTQGVNSMIRGMASKFIDKQVTSGFDSLFGMFKPKAAAFQMGQPQGINIFGHNVIPGAALSAAQNAAKSGVGKDVATNTLNTTLLQTNTQLQMLNQNLGAGAGGINAPGGAGGGGGLGPFGFGGGVGAPSSGGLVPFTSNPVSTGDPVLDAGLKDRQQGDASHGTINVHIHSPIQTGDAKRHARDVVKAMDMRKARYA